jgi:hypothetical protein
MKVDKDRIEGLKKSKAKEDAIDKDNDLDKQVNSKQTLLLSFHFKSPSLKLIQKFKETN